MKNLIFITIAALLISCGSTEVTKQPTTSIEQTTQLDEINDLKQEVQQLGDDLLQELDSIDTSMPTFE